MHNTVFELANHCPYDELNDDCTNDIVILNPSSEISIYVSHQGKNLEHLTVEEWLIQNQRKQYDEKYKIKTSDIGKITLSELTSGLYQGVVSIDFTEGDDVFEIEWYDADKNNEQNFLNYQQLVLSIEFVSTTSIDTNNWQTYESEDYSFSIQYPRGFSISETDNRISFDDTSITASTAPPVLSILVTQNSKALSIDDWLAQEHESHYFLYYDQREKFTGDYYSGIKLMEEGDPEHFNYYFGNDEYIYTISSYLKEAECDKIADTFKIFDSKTINTSDWQTYEDKTNGYSIKYPSDYLIKMNTDGYIVFDPVSIDTSDTTYLHISVTVEDNDFHTYRLGILTNPAVDSDSPIDEEDVTIDSLDGKKIILKNALGETIIHYLVSYLGKVYDISAGDSVDSDVLDKVIVSFDINQLDGNVDIADTNEFTGKECVSNNDCGAFPCVNNKCLVQECTSDSECSKGTCGQYVTPVPGYCTMMDSL